MTKKQGTLKKLRPFHGLEYYATTRAMLPKTINEWKMLTVQPCVEKIRYNTSYRAVTIFAKLGSNKSLDENDSTLTAIISLGGFYFFTYVFLQTHILLFFPFECSPAERPGCPRHSSEQQLLQETPAAPSTWPPPFSESVDTGPSTTQLHTVCLTLTIRKIYIYHLKITLFWGN